MKLALSIIILAASLLSPRLDTLAQDICEPSTTATDPKSFSAIIQQVTQQQHRLPSSSVIKGYWTGLEIDRDLLMKVSAPLRSLSSSSTVASRRDAVVSAIQSSSDIAVFYSQNQSPSPHSSASSPTTPTVRDLKINRSEGPSLADLAASRENPEAYYARQPLEHAGQFWKADPSASRPLNTKSVLLLNPLKADEGTVIHEFIHANFNQAREDCYREQVKNPLKECPAKLNHHDHSHHHSSNSDQNIDEDLEEFQSQAALILEELDVYSVLAKEGASLGLSQEAIQNAHAGIEAYLNGSAVAEQKDIVSLRGLLDDFKSRLAKKSNQSATNSFKILRNQMEGLERKVKDFRWPGQES